MSSHRQRLAVFLLALTLIASYCSFASIADAVLTDGASVILWPAIFFFCTVLFVALGALVWQERPLRLPASIALVTPSLIFTPTLVHTAVVLGAMGLVFVGLTRVSNELRARVQISVYRALMVGMASLLFALSLVLSSQYYAHIKSLAWERLVPSFNLGEGSADWLLRITGKVSPSLGSLQDRELTVDAFLGQLRPIIQVGEFEGVVEAGIGEAIRRAEIARSRSELSRLLGREVRGDESINAILSEVMRKKVLAFVTQGTNAGDESVPFLPFFLAVLLFFTVYPIGSLLSPIPLGLATIIFSYFVRGGWIVIGKETVEQERII